MPQMKPMNWIMLFMIMNMIILMINIKIYFFKNMKYKNLLLNMKYKNNYWKW